MGKIKLPSSAVKPEQPSNNSNAMKDLWQTRRKRGRLIIRNLPFKITDDQLREHFMKFGDLKDVNILRRPDGKLVGCGFVEFSSKESATKAIAATSGKPLLNRPIIVDWALPKKVFRTSRNGKQQEPEIKEEVISDDDDSKERIPKISEKEIKKEESDSESSEDDVEDDIDDRKYDRAAAEDESNSDIEMDSESDSEPEVKKKLMNSNDVKDGCTIFIKNVPFTATSDELRACMIKFGPIVYALICIDPLTEHSKGTAFVKFKRKECADECLKANQLKLGSNILELHPALDKQQLHNKTTQAKTVKRSRDGRNLYLIKEGVVQAGSIAAKGVSAPDMGKRLKLEQWKTQMLRNLSMFISKTRLAVHNLPPTLNDEGLRKIFKKHSPEGAKIFEARVMRDLRRVDGKGQGISKEFGFVSYGRHEDALAALRAINNNPSIFSKQRRPIVGFSVENKTVLNARQKRLEMSRTKNPYFEGSKNLKKGDDKARNQGKFINTGETESFAGVEAHSGQTIKMPSARTLKSQASLHRTNLHQERKKIQLQKKIDKVKNSMKKKSQQSQVRESKKQNLQDMKEENVFNNLVNKYKQQLETVVNIKKWYE